MRPWRSTYRIRRWMSAEKSYQQGRCSERRTGRRKGWAGERERYTYKPRPAHPDFLEIENWIARLPTSPEISRNVNLPRLIHVTDVSLLADRTLSFSLFLSLPCSYFLLPVTSRHFSRGHYSLSVKLHFR